MTTIKTQAGIPSLGIDLGEIDLEAAENPSPDSAPSAKSSPRSAPVEPPQVDSWPGEAELFDPTTGELVAASDVDSLVDSYERIKRMADELNDARREFAFALAKLTEGTTEAKTRRLRGERRRVKVEMPGTDFDQSILRECYHSFPQFRDELLKVETVKVKLREWKKVREETGPEDFETFKKMIAMAERPSRATPTISVED